MTNHMQIIIWKPVWLQNVQLQQSYKIQAWIL